METRTLARRLLSLLLLGLLLSFVLAPFLWQVVTALKPEGQLAALPPLLPTAPSMVERVRSSLEGVADPSTCSPVVAFRRGRAEFAWTDYAFMSEDTERGERREAHGRLLLAANPWFQAVFTFSYWTDDTAWAVPIWERIVETIELGDGVPLETPRDHWSLRDA